MYLTIFQAKIPKRVSSPAIHAEQKRTDAKGAKVPNNEIQVKLNSLNCAFLPC